MRACEVELELSDLTQNVDSENTYTVPVDSKKMAKQHNLISRGKVHKQQYQNLQDRDETHQPFHGEDEDVGNTDNHVAVDIFSTDSNDDDHELFLGVSRGPTTSVPTLRGSQRCLLSFVFEFEPWNWEFCQMIGTLNHLTHTIMPSQLETLEFSRLLFNDNVRRHSRFAPFVLLQGILSILLLLDFWGEIGSKVGVCVDHLHTLHTPHFDWVKSLRILGAGIIWIPTSFFLPSHFKLAQLFLAINVTLYWCQILIVPPLLFRCETWYSILAGVIMTVTLYPIYFGWFQINTFAWPWRMFDFSSHSLYRYAILGGSAQCCMLWACLAGLTYSGRPLFFWFMLIHTIYYMWCITGVVFYNPHIGQPPVFNWRALWSYKNCP